MVLPEPGQLQTSLIDQILDGRGTRGTVLVLQIFLMHPGWKIRQFSCPFFVRLKDAKTQLVEPGGGDSNELSQRPLLPCTPQWPQNRGYYPV